jgi:hypothetical protein
MAPSLMQDASFSKSWRSGQLRLALQALVDGQLDAHVEALLVDPHTDFELEASDLLWPVASSSLSSAGARIAGSLHWRGVTLGSLNSDGLESRAFPKHTPPRSPAAPSSVASTVTTTSVGNGCRTALSRAWSRSTRR